MRAKFVESALMKTNQNSLLRIRSSTVLAVLNRTRSHTLTFLIPSPGRFVQKILVLVSKKRFKLAFKEKMSAAGYRTSVDVAAFGIELVCEDQAAELCVEETLAIAGNTHTVAADQHYTVWVLALRTSPSSPCALILIPTIHGHDLLHLLLHWLVLWWKRLAISWARRRQIRLVRLLGWLRRRGASHDMGVPVNMWLELDSGGVIEHLLAWSDWRSLVEVRVSHRLN